MTPPLLRVSNLTKTFRPARRWPTGGSTRTYAVDGVTFEMQQGESLGIVGESGCGKSTLARCILRLVEPSAGQVEFAGQDVRAMGRRQIAGLRRDAQMIFQDPYASLNPRMTVEDIVAEGLVIHGIGRAGRDRRARVAALLESVGLNPEHMERFPHAFSGGQRQRIGIARALAVEPKLVICDEPVSALDVSVQAQVINLLKDLQERMGLAYLFIAHDLAVVENFCDRVAVMYLGRVVELAETHALYTRPRHPYTSALLSAIPVPDPGARRLRQPLTGDMPSPAAPPSGCHFHPRCPRALHPVCSSERPPLRPRADGHIVACHLED